MKTILFSHPVCLEHHVAPGFPEQPDRLQTILETLKSPAFSNLEHRQASRIAIDDLLLVHSRDYVDKVMSLIPASGFWALDCDTIVSPRSGEAAMYAAGSIVDAVDATIKGEANNSFCAIRPPGHHAGPDYSGGFCIFNNIAIGALVAQKRHGLKRIAVVDFDVHHGNGTQDIFQNDPGLFYSSTHQFSLMPHSGAENERGVFNNVLNMPLPDKADGALLRQAISEKLLPRLREFKPEILLVSAGFDAHRDDPLSNMNMVEDDYEWLSRTLLKLSGDLCNNRLIATLEGGYNLKALGACVSAFIKPMLE
ncbi:MAG: histone deacetylase family protein [Alphaproteobacteria bacterium]|nr:histone deacetylase family protein [Alphaproteobacteria bacterium]